MNRMSFVFALVVTVVLITASSALSVQAADKQTLTYTAQMGPIISIKIETPGDQPDHQLVRTVRTDMTLSDNPDWNEVPVINYGQSDLVGGTGKVSGFALRTHRNGDQTYYRYQGTLMTGPGKGSADTTGEGTVELVGGTGKFKNAKGAGTWRSSEGISTITMEVQY